MMAESPADILRRAADRLLNPRLAAGVTVKYLGNADVSTAGIWHERIGRTFLAVEAGDGKATIAVWDPDSDDEWSRGDAIYVLPSSVEVVVPERDKALAGWLRSEAHISGADGAVGYHAETIARAILGEVET